MEIKIDSAQSYIQYSVEGTNIKYTEQILYSHESYKDKRDVFKGIYICVAL